MLWPIALAAHLQASPQIEVRLLWSTDCPVAQAWVSRVAAWSRTQPAGRVTFEFPNDSTEAAQSYARRMGLTGTVVGESGADIAFRYGLDRLPSVVLKRNDAVVYVGAIADQRAPSESAKFYLADASRAAAAGSSFSPPRTTPLGCTIPSPLMAKPGSPITYMKHVRPMLQRYCLPCHSPGGSAPFRLDRHPDAQRWSHMIEDVLRSGMMPPVRRYDRTTNLRAPVTPDTSMREQISIWRSYGAPMGEGEATDFRRQESRGIPLDAVVPPGLGLPRLVDISLETTDKLLAGYEILEVDQGEVRMAWTFLVPKSTKVVRDQGTRWRPVPGDWRLVSARIPGTPTLPSPWKIARNPNEQVVLRLALLGTEKRGPWKFSAQPVALSPNAIQVTPQRLRTADGRVQAFMGVVDVFESVVFVRPAKLIAHTPLTYPSAAETALNDLGRALAITELSPGFFAPTFEFGSPLNVQTGANLTYYARFGGPSMDGSIGPAAMTFGDVWNGATAETTLLIAKP